MLPGPPELALEQLLELLEEALLPTPLPGPRLAAGLKGHRGESLAMEAGGASLRPWQQTVLEAAPAGLEGLKGTLLLLVADAGVGLDETTEGARSDVGGLRDPHTQQ